MSAVLVLKTVLKIVTTTETVEGSSAAATQAIHWTIITEPVLVSRCVNTFSFTVHFLLDVDECSNSNGGCAQTCHNTGGSYYCVCSIGYSLAPNRHGCDGE